MESCCTTGTGQAKLGQKIQPFTLETYNPVTKDFSDVSSQSLQGVGRWIVLVFYPADFTFVCPTELEDLAESHQALKDLGAEVISVSTDSKYAHLAWRNSERLLEKVNYQMASDPTGCLSRYFGVYDESAGTAYRGTFIINPDGVLIGSEVNFYNVGRHTGELLRKMEANVYLRKNPNEACPARWEPGKQTLTPSAKIVGNIFDAMRNLPRGM